MGDDPGDDLDDEKRDDEAERRRDVPRVGSFRQAVVVRMVVGVVVTDSRQRRLGA